MSKPKLFFKIYPRLKFNPEPIARYSEICVGCNREMATGSMYTCSNEDALAVTYSPRKEKPLYFNKRSIYN